MFSQLFGKYLVEKNILSKSMLDDINGKMSSTRAKLGVIAISQGMISEEQAETINKLQTQRDAKFGTIATEEGILTDEQVEKLLELQGSTYVKFVQLVSEAGGYKVSEVEQFVVDFQKENGFDDKEMQGLKDDNFDDVIPVFAFSSKPYITDICSLALRNITRFVSTDFYVEKIKHINLLEYRCLCGQKIVGDVNITIAFAAKDDGKGIVEVANGFTKENLTSAGIEAYDAVGEFVNCISGLFATALSKKDIKTEILPQFSYENQFAKGDAYAFPIYINETELILYVSVDENVTVGEMPVIRKMSINEGSELSEDSKGTAVIVDDSGMSRKMLRSILEKGGYTVIAEASDGLEGVLAYKQYSPDVITLDITMPNLDGVEALRQIRDYDPDANAIMITAAGQQNKVIEALKIGAKKFITKPFDPEEIIKSMNELCQ
ncbi:MAG: response regulator [Lachnospira sp.]